MSLSNIGAGGSILTKLLQSPDYVPLGRGDNARTTFGRPAPQNFGEPKNLQISARLLTTFDFDSEYLWNESIYRTSEKKLDQPLPLPR